MDIRTQGKIGEGVRKVEPVPKSGVSLSLYVKQRNVPHLEGLKGIAAERDVPFSDFLNNAVRQAYFQQRMQVSVTPGAYLAIAAGDLSALRTVRREDGSTELMLNDNVASPEDMDCPDKVHKATVYSVGPALLSRADDEMLDQLLRDPDGDGDGGRRLPGRDGKAGNGSGGGHGMESGGLEPEF